MKRIKTLGFAAALVILAFGGSTLRAQSLQSPTLAPPRLPANALAVPLVVQAQNYSCGAGALLSILYYWHAFDGVEADLYAPLETTEKDGTEPPKLAEVAIKYGLAAELKTGLSLADLRAGLAAGATIILDLQSGPAQADWSTQWEGGHYVVLVGMDDDYAYFMDPATEKSYEYVPLPELVERWHDYENRHGVVQRYVQSGVVIHGTKPTTAFPGPLVRLGGGTELTEEKSPSEARSFHDVKARALPQPLCGILASAHSGRYSPEELCRAYNGSFCQGVALGEAICRAGHATFCEGATEPQAICKVGGGAFCDDATTISAAVCRVSRGPFCDTLDAPAKLRYFEMYDRCARDEAGA